MHGSSQAVRCAADGLVVCHGQGCHVTLTNVKFKRCTLVATAGARVTLSHCSFVLKPSRRGSVAILASDEGTLVQTDECTIFRGTQGVLVQRRARLEATALTITEVTRLGVEVKDAGSAAHLTNCIFAEFRFPAQDAADSGLKNGATTQKANSQCEAPRASLNVTGDVAGLGLYAHSEGYLKLQNLSMTGASVHVSSAASADVASCNVTAAAPDCASLSFTSGAGGSVVNSMLLRSSVGISVSGTGSKVVMERCYSLEHALAGVHACDGGTVVGSRCSASADGATGVAYLVATGGVLDLKGCVCSEARQGVCVRERGRLFARHLTAQGCIAAGLEVGEGGTASFVQCTVKHCKNAGVMVGDEGSNVDMRNCVVTRCAGNCFGAKAGAHARLKFCDFSHSTQNCGV